MLYEIRSYHFDPSKFEEYKLWAKQYAGPYFLSKMDIVGFWLGVGMEPEYGGSIPWEGDLRPVNMTWIIRWQDREQRDRVWEEVWADPELERIFSMVPGGIESYLRTEVRFAEDFLKEI